MHFLCLVRVGVVKSEVVQQAVGDVKGNLGGGGVASFFAFATGLLGVYHQFIAQAPVLLVSEVKTDDIGFGSAVKEFGVDFGYRLVANYCDADCRLVGGKTAADITGQFSEFVKVAVKVRVSAGDINNYVGLLFGQIWSAFLCRLKGRQFLHRFVGRCRIGDSAVVVRCQGF